MVLGWLRLLVMALPLVTIGAMDCIFCVLTDSSKYPDIPKTCGDNKECLMGKETAPDLGPIHKKGTMDTSSYGHDAKPVTSQSVINSLTFTCRYGELCSRAPTPAGSLRAAIITCLALGVPLLLQ